MFNVFSCDFCCVFFFLNFIVPKLPVAQKIRLVSVYYDMESIAVPKLPVVPVWLVIFVPRFFFRFFAVPKLPVVLNSRLRCDFHYILVVQCVLATLCLLF